MVSCVVYMNLADVLTSSDVDAQLWRGPEVKLLLVQLDRQLVSRDEQDETISALLEICVGLAGFGFYGDVLRFAPHVNLHGWTANLHRKLDFSYTERQKKTNTGLY